jgi:acyl-CoA synthetase (AMP-forming)/AMP-acid ligase II
MERVTNMFVVPTIQNRLVRDDGAVFRGRDWSSFRLMISNAAPLSTSTKEAVLDAVPGLELHEFYGSTEAGIVTNLRPADQLRKVRCAGQPFMLNRVAVLDEDGKAVEPGELGELFSASPYLFEGYNGLPEASAEVERAGMVGVGDLAQMDDIVDRKNDLIISGGINIYPREIEEALIRHPAVREVAVIGVPDPEWGEQVRAFLVLGAEASSPESVLAEACADLADYKRPRSFSVMDELPKTSSGKVLKRELRERYWSGPVKI